VFFEPARTPFDLNFRLFGVSVRVHPFFWLLSALLGWGASMDAGHPDFRLLFLWIGCVFVSILVHEFGHVLMGMLFGAHGHIVLYSFGGLAVGSNQLTNRWQRIAVSFAGPLAGFLLLGLVWGVATYLGSEGMSRYAQRAVSYLTWINLFWGLLNLLPIWPLDGGQISRDLFGWLLPGRGTSVALGISLVVAGLLAIHGLLLNVRGQGLPVLDQISQLDIFGDFYMFLMFGMLALNNFQALQFESQHRPWDRMDDY
jgi:Zn-dependent protease